MTMTKEQIMAQHNKAQRLAAINKKMNSVYNKDKDTVMVELTRTEIFDIASLSATEAMVCNRKVLTAIKEFEADLQELLALTEEEKDNG